MHARQPRFVDGCSPGGAPPLLPQPCLGNGTLKQACSEAHRQSSPFVRARGPCALRPHDNPAHGVRPVTRASRRYVGARMAMSAALLDEGMATPTLLESELAPSYSHMFASLENLPLPESADKGLAHATQQSAQGQENMPRSGNVGSHPARGKYKCAKCGQPKRGHGASTLGLKRRMGQSAALRQSGTHLPVRRSTYVAISPVQRTCKTLVARWLTSPPGWRLRRTAVGGVAQCARFRRSARTCWMQWRCR